MCSGAVVVTSNMDNPSEEVSHIFERHFEHSSILLEPFAPCLVLKE